MSKLPIRQNDDAVHIATASIREIDYLLTWNCRHLANAQILRKIEEVCDSLSARIPIVCTPEELMGD